MFKYVTLKIKSDNLRIFAIILLMVLIHMNTLTLKNNVLVTYNSFIQGFMAPDPLNTNFNVYDFVNNDPVNTIDRNGLCPICGAGLMCTYDNGLIQESSRYVEATLQFTEQFNLSVPDVHSIFRVSAIEHCLYSGSFFEQISYARRLLSLGREVSVLRRSYVNRFPEQFRSVIAHSPLTGDLALLQPLKFIGFAEEANIPLKFWQRTQRQILRRQVPSLFEWSMETISRTNGFRSYASRFSENVDAFNHEMANFRNSLLYDAKLVIDVQLTDEQFHTGLQHEYNRLLLIHPEIRQQINPDNPSLRGVFNPKNRSLLNLYQSARDAPTLPPNVRSLAYFPERTMGGNSTYDTWLFPNLEF